MVALSRFEQFHAADDADAERASHALDQLQVEMRALENDVGNAERAGAKDPRLWSTFRLRMANLGQRLHDRQREAEQRRETLARVGLTQSHYVAADKVCDLLQKLMGRQAARYGIVDWEQATTERLARCGEWLSKTETGRAASERLLRSRPADLPELLSGSAVTAADIARDGEGQAQHLRAWRATKAREVRQLSQWLHERAPEHLRMAWEKARDEAAEDIERIDGWLAALGHAPHGSRQRPKKAAATEKAALALISGGTASDREIAKRLERSPSWVRGVRDRAGVGRSGRGYSTTARSRR
jgi:hypothetical protein